MKDRKDTEHRVASRSVIPAGVTRIEKHRGSRQRLSGPSTLKVKSSINRYMWSPVGRHSKEIRLLDLEAGVGNSPLQGRLQHVFLDSPARPAYETISYAWGDTALVDSILVDNKSLPIPASAGSALRRMRSVSMTRTFWIDCVCIDQNDNHEKGHQVGLMAEIFKNSLWTLAHLGDDDDNTAERAFYGLSVIYKTLQRVAMEKSVSNGETVDIENWCSLRAKVDLVAIKDIMMKPYFT